MDRERYSAEGMDTGDGFTPEDGVDLELPVNDNLAKPKRKRRRPHPPIRRLAETDTPEPPPTPLPSPAPTPTPTVPKRRHRPETIERMREAHLRKNAAMSPEERRRKFRGGVCGRKINSVGRARIAAAVRYRWALASEEEKREHAEKTRAVSLNAWASMTPAERAERCRKTREGQARGRARRERERARDHDRR